MIAINKFFIQANIGDASGCEAAKKQKVKAIGLASAAKRTSERSGEGMQSYERRMRVFNLGVILVALIALTILIEWLSTAWVAFEKSLAHTF